MEEIRIVARCSSSSSCSSGSNTLCRPIKKAKLDASRDAASRQYYRSSDVVDCALGPWIRKIMNLPNHPSNYEELAEILRTIHSNMDYHGNIPLPQPNIDDHSWISLHRVLTLRLGYIAGSLPKTAAAAATTTLSEDNIWSQFGRFLSLSFICLRLCYKRVILYSTIIDTHEIRETVHSVLGLLNQLHENNDSMDPETMENIHQNCMDLFHVWLLEPNDTTTTTTTTTDMLLLDRCLLEELALVLVRAATISSRTKNNVSTFFQQNNVDRIMRGQSTAVFQIALQVLNDDNNDGMEAFLIDQKINHRPSDEDELFFVKCLVLVGHRPSLNNLERLILLIEQSAAVDDISFHSEDTSALTVQAMDSLQYCIDYLTPDQRSKSARAIQELAIRQMDWESTSSTHLVTAAFHFLEALWTQHTPTPSFCSSNHWESLFEVCFSLALEETSFTSHKLRSNATSLLLVLLSMMSAKQQPLTDNRKRRVFRALSQLLLLPQSSGDILSRAIQLLCDEWIHNDVVRKDILQLHPGLLVSLAQVVTAYRVTESDKAKIVNSFWTILQKESQNNFMARQSKILGSIVVMACLPSRELFSSESSASSLLEATTTTRMVAMTLLLTLSENPCNRRIMAQQPGLLSSMIHFVRQFPYSGNSDPPPPTVVLHPRRSCVVPPQPDDVKKRILLLAQAL